VLTKSLPEMGRLFYFPFLIIFDLTPKNKNHGTNHWSISSNWLTHRCFFNLPRAGLLVLENKRLPEKPGRNQYGFKANPGGIKKRQRTGPGGLKPVFTLLKKQKRILTRKNDGFNIVCMTFEISSAGFHYTKCKNPADAGLFLFFREANLLNKNF